MATGRFSCTSGAARRRLWLGGSASALCLALALPAATQAQSVWLNVPGARTWDTPIQWAPAGVPNAPGVEVQFTPVGIERVNMMGNTTRTVGTLTMTRNSSFSISAIGAGNGTVNLNSGDPLVASRINVTGTGQLRFERANARFTTDTIIDVVQAAASVRFDQQLQGAGNVTKTGPGGMILNGAGNFSGTLTVNGGVLRINENGRLGAGGAASGTRINDGAALHLAGTTIGNEFLTLDGDGVILRSVAGTSTWSGPITLLRNSTFEPEAGTTMRLLGDISGAGFSITISGPGTIELGGNNSFTGGLTLGAGTLRLSSDNAAGGSTITTTGSVIDYAAGINNPAPIVIASNTTRLQVLAGAATQSGVISEDVAGRPLEKIGGGTLTLSAVNTFTGPLTVSAGTLALDATGRLATGAITIAAGAAMETATGLGDGLAAASTLVVENSGSVTATGGASSPAMIGRAGVGTTFNNRAGATVTGMIASDAGAGTLIVNNDAGATWTTPAGGSATLSGPDDRLNNSGTFSLGAGTSLTGWESVSNDGTLAMGAGSTLGFAGALANTGTITVSGAATLSGSVNNAGGIIRMTDGGAGDVLNITGNLAGGTIELDVDLSALNAGLADSVVVTGAVTGAVTLNLTQIGALADQAAPVTLLSGADITGAAITAAGLPISGAFLTELALTPVAAQLVVRVNPAVGNVAGALGIIDAMTMRSFARPGGATPGCAPGGWAEAVAGRGQASFTSTAAGTLTQARATISHEGLSAGLGLGCAEIGGGWQIAAGVHFGAMTGRTSQVAAVAGGQIDIGSSFQRSGAGAGFTATRDRLAVDVGMEATWTRLRFSEAVLGGGGGVGLAGAAMATSGIGANLRLSWRMSVGDGLSFVPMAGMSLGRSAGGSVAVGPAGAPTATMTVAPHISRIAMAGGRLERERASSSGSGWNRQYLTLAIFSDQSGDRRTTVTPTGGGAPSSASTGNLGTYAEIGLGISTSRVIRGRAGAPGLLDTWLRADLRGSDRLDNTALSAGMMLRF